MNWKSTMLVSGAGLVATWMGLVSAPVAPGYVAAPVARPTRQATAGAASDIERQAARLQTKLRADSNFRPPSRNPFRFGARIAPSPANAPVVAPVEPLPPPVVAPPRPMVKLTGIASDVVNGATERTAIITTDAGLFLVREGETAGEYRVTKIEDEAVDLEGASGSLRLTLSNPSTR